MVLRRQFLEQIRILQHIRHVVRRITYEHHARLGLHDAHAAGERLVGHVVLHDVDQIFAGLLRAPPRTRRRPRHPRNQQAPDAPVVLLTNSLATVTSPPEINMPCGENSE